MVNIKLSLFTIFCVFTSQVHAQINIVAPTPVAAGCMYILAQSNFMQDLVACMPLGESLFSKQDRALITSSAMIMGLLRYQNDRPHGYTTKTQAERCGECVAKDMLASILAVSSLKALSKVGDILLSQKMIKNFVTKHKLMPSNNIIEGVKMGALWYAKIQAADIVNWGDQKIRERLNSKPSRSRF